MTEALLKTKLSAQLKALNEAHSRGVFKPHNQLSLFSGLAGEFLFRLYYQRFLNKSNESLENELIDFVQAGITNETLPSFTLCEGLTGFAWFVNHLQQQDFLDLDNDLLVEFDEVIYEYALRQFEVKNHDYLHGALGAMFYLAERLPDGSDIRENLLVLLEKLAELASSGEKGVFWYESEVMMDYMSKNNQVVNLHISHGQASKIAVLSKMVSGGITEAVDLLNQAVDFLLYTRGLCGEAAQVPVYILNGETTCFTHLGWCRGNIAISLALVTAANVTNNSVWRQNAIEMALHTLQHDTPDNAHISDAAFCHGTAGLAYMYKRLFELSGDVRFQAAANQWMEYTLNSAVFDDGIAGFKLIDGLTKKWVNDYSLLTGTAGVGLVLLHFLEPSLQHWDSCFLVS